MADMRRIEPLLAEKVASLGLELYETKFFRAGSRGILRIFIDKPGGLTIADCERASHEISVLLDVENFSNTPYTLEVSSPGLDRPLIAEKDFKRVLGNQIKVQVKEGEDKDKTLYGRLLSCADNSITLETEQGQKQLSLNYITGGKVEISFK
jgi:ribosome maturation factor RimP